MGIIKRSVVIGGHKTSVSLEDAFWSELRRLARARPTTISDLLTEIDGDPGRVRNLSSAARIFVLREVQRAVAQAAHVQAVEIAIPVNGRTQ